MPQSPRDFSARDLSDYVDQTAELLLLPLQSEHRPGVIENFTRIKAIADLVLEFPLLEDVEPAAVFQP